MKVFFEQKQPLGDWLQTSNWSAPSQQEMLVQLQNMKKLHPNNPVRAVDENGRLIDILF